MIVSGRARVAGVIGWPVEHSRSPRLHGFWLERHGIDGAYVPLAVPPEKLADVVRALADAGVRGVNLTIPHKEAGLRLCDEVAPAAARLGAVNTLVFQRGRVVGSNTDGFGFMENLRTGTPAWRADSGPAVVIGAGGAARAVAAALLDEGAPEVRVVNRTRVRADDLARDLGGPVAVVDWEDRGAALADAALLANTTSLGMAGQPALDLALDRLPKTAVVTDIVYTPLQTLLLAAAKACGNPTVDGLGMLLHQARPGFEAWFGVAPQVDAALRAFVLAD